MSQDMSAEEYQAQLLLGENVFDLVMLAQRAGVSLDTARNFWYAFGKPVTDINEVQFTETDADALARLARLLEVSGISPETVVAITRAMAHSTERLVLWQFEAFVEDAAKRLELDDVSARLVVLDHIAELAPLVESQLVHSWRRQLAAVAGRYFEEFSQAGTIAVADDQLPLPRTVGFADLVSYSTRSAELSPVDLAHLVERFETSARDVIARRGGRVVKTVGDAVLFVTDDVTVGGHIALELADVMAKDKIVPNVRVGMVHGRILSRFGDVYGPPVTLASRLTEMAVPGGVLVDDHTASLLQDVPTFSLEAQEDQELAGLGKVRPSVLSWSAQYRERLQAAEDGEV